MDIIPNKFLTEIPLLEKKLSKNLKNKTESKRIKQDFDKKLFEYIDYLYDSKQLSKHTDKEQKDIIENIMDASVMGTSYDKAIYQKKNFVSNLRDMVNNETITDKNTEGVKKYNVRNDRNI
ncbi:MAG: hypothetical protein K0R72_1269 [Clostridia bacterium]|jgi:hypothetical protein|nr:hypothetical protein [Clostridia bacterium]